MIKVVKNICLVIVLLVTGYGIIFNISHFVSLRQTITYNFESETMKKINNNKKITEITQNKINELSEGTFTADEIETIQNDFMMITETWNEMSLWKLEGKKKLNINEVYALKRQIYSLPLLPITSLTKIKDRYTNDSYEEVLNQILVSASASADNDFSSAQDSYRHTISLDMSEAESYLNMYMEYVNYLSQWVIEYGGATNA
mgnify:CR=1 FL=1